MNFVRRVGRACPFSTGGRCCRWDIELLNLLQVHVRFRREHSDRQTEEMAHGTHHEARTRRPSSVSSASVGIAQLRGHSRWKGMMPQPRGHSTLGCEWISEWHLPMGAHSNTYSNSTASQLPPMASSVWMCVLGLDTTSLTLDSGQAEDSTALNEYRYM